MAIDFFTTSMKKHLFFQWYKENNNSIDIILSICFTKLTYKQLYLYTSVKQFFGEKKHFTKNKNDRSQIRHPVGNITRISV